MNYEEEKEYLRTKSIFELVAFRYYFHTRSGALDEVLMERLRAQMKKDKERENEGHTRTLQTM